MSGAQNRTFQYDAVFSLSMQSQSLSELDFCLTPPPGQLNESVILKMYLSEVCANTLLGYEVRYSDGNNYRVEQNSLTDQTIIKGTNPTTGGMNINGLKACSDPYQGTLMLKDRKRIVVITSCCKRLRMFDNPSVI